MQNNYKTEGAYKQKTLKIDNSLYKLFLKLNYKRITENLQPVT